MLNRSLHAYPKRTACGFTDFPKNPTIRLFALGHAYSLTIFAVSK